MKVLVVISALLAVASATNLGFAYSSAAPYWGGIGYNGLYQGNALGYNGLYQGNALGYNGLYQGNALGYNGILPYSGIHGYSSAVLPYTRNIAAPIAHAYAHPYAYNALATKTQYHAQDEFGQASFGHATHDQTHDAFRNAAGGVTGHYSYVNPTGKIVEASYIADQLGYRVASNDLPVAPAIPHVPVLEGPAPVHDTPEVVAARAQHLAAHAEVKSRHRRGAILRSPLAYGVHAYPYSSLPHTTHVLPYTSHVVPYTSHAYGYSHIRPIHSIY